MDEASSDQALLEPKNQERTKPAPHLDDVLSDLKFGVFQIKMLVLVGGGYFAVCAEMMLFVFLSSPAKKEWNLAEYEFPWLPFSTGVSGIVGGFLFGSVSDHFGRRIPFIIGMVVVAVFGLASAFANSFPLFVALRCMVTFGIAAFEAAGFVFLLEFLPRERRGTVMVVVTLCGALGAVLVASLAWVMLERLGWRWFVGTCASPAWLLLLMLLVVHEETPRFLFSSGRTQAGRKVLSKIARQNNTTLAEGDIVCPTTEQRGHLRQLFSRDACKHTIVLSLVWFLQAMGYWGVTTYLPEYMTSQGVNPYFNMFSVFIGEIPGLILAMILIERRRIGRIRCLKAFSAVTSMSLFLFAFVPVQQAKTVFAITCYFSMVPIYSILNTFTPEVYPTNIRSIAMGWVNVVIEIPGLITPFVGEFLLSSSIAWLYPVVWAAIFVIQFGCMFGLSQETVGQDLSDVTLTVSDAGNGGTEVQN
ncbi:hypothetical protein BaRGS_00034661 [Batillaria attramentaria]|uniref:Major facilitator superfamily (MFS) profile domain-containing protein n=1 Tax=Batillaria attramentaria TaxID=370345 RepID=A0ABD0JGX5_9CAEN